MKLLMHAFAVVLLFSSLILPAHAGNALSTTLIESFLASMPDVESLAQTMKDEGKNDVLKQRMTADLSEKFNPYSLGVSALKAEFPSDYEKLGTIVGSHGFSSAENWANTADMIMQAYVALKADAAGMMQKMEEAKAQIPPELLAQMPPDAKAEMDRSFKMAENLSKTPKENVAAVSPYMQQIEAMMAKSED